jgi:hypothetical protein
MKLNMRDNTHISAGVAKTILVTSDTSEQSTAVMFFATINALAKDKIAYPIRELSTNAWDASKGNFEVTLPTHINPTFKVRDYGPGMSPQQMEDIYAKKGASTKRGSNDEVGGWGIGRFSPYAYLMTENGTGSYTVISYNGGKMYTYIMSLNERGNPQINVLPEVDTDQPSGLEVSFAVRKGDIETFRRKAAEILWSFQPQPKITPNPGWEKPVVLTHGDGWCMYEVGTVPFGGPTVRMGCVSYPFDLSQIDAKGLLSQYDAVLFDAEIGSLSVTLSREALAYDDRTKRTLKKLVADFEHSFIRKVQAEIDKADTFFKACHIFEHDIEGWVGDRLSNMRSLVSWRGMNLPVRVYSTDIKFMLSRGIPEKFEMIKQGLRPAQCVDTKVVIEHVPHRSIERLDKAGIKAEDQILWVRCKRMDRDRALAAIGNPSNVINLDDFKIKGERKTATTVRRRKVLKVTNGRYMTPSTENVDLKEGGFFVRKGESQYRTRNGGGWYRVNASQSVNYSTFSEIVEGAVRLGLLGDGEEILIATDKDNLNEDWTDVVEYMKENMRPLVDMSMFTSTYGKNLHNVPAHIQRLAAITLSNAPEDIELLRVDAKVLVQSLSPTTRRDETNNSNLAYRILAKLGVSITPPTVECPIQVLTARYNRLRNEYPMFSILLEHDQYGQNRNAESRLNEYFRLLKKEKEFDELVRGIDHQIITEEEVRLVA